MKEIKIKDNTKLGYRVATIGDSVNVNGRMEYQRGNVQYGIAHTINTENDKAVVTGGLIIWKI